MACGFLSAIASLTLQKSGRILITVGTDNYILMENSNKTNRNTKTKHYLLISNPKNFSFETGFRTFVSPSAYFFPRTELSCTGTSFNLTFVVDSRTRNNLDPEQGDLW